MSNRIPLLAGGLVLGLAFGLAGLGQAALAEVYKTAASAEQIRKVAIEPAMKVEFDGVPGPPEKMRAIFHEEMERRKFRVDEVSSTVMTIRWNGPFREMDDQNRLQLKGRGGNQSRTELGLSIILGAPAEEDGEATYSLGARISDSDGEIWKGKVIVVSASKQKSQILREMVRVLLDSVGRTVVFKPATGG